MRPNGNDQGFLASYFEFVDSDFINEPRPNVAKGHERVFLRTLLSNFPDDLQLDNASPTALPVSLSIDTWRLKKEHSARAEQVPRHLPAPIP